MKKTANNAVDLSRSDKLLLVMFELSGGKSKSIQFEDIVVAAFKKFPDDFHLRGYKDYPDSGDLVHKPLYEFRKTGLVEAGNKIFTLTARGIATAEQLTKKLSGRTVVKEDRLSSFAEKEAARIEDLESLKFYLDNESEKILDVDFYNFLGVTVRTPKNDFIGRLNTVKELVSELESIKNISPLRSKLPSFAKFMLDKFDGIVKQKTN